MTGTAQLINQTSGNTEYYSPIDIVDAARYVMSGIDLDPASSALANARIGAARYFTEAEDGLACEWAGRVWLNHPFSRTQNKAWIEKLVQEYYIDRVEQACCITYAATSEAWFSPLMGFPQCFLSPRTNYYLPDGTLKRGVTKGSVVTYLGPQWKRFWLAFRHRGSVTLPAGRFLS